MRVFGKVTFRFPSTSSLRKRSAREFLVVSAGILLAVHIGPAIVTGDLTILGSLAGLAIIFYLSRHPVFTIGFVVFTHLTMGVWVDLPGVPFLNSPLDFGYLALLLAFLRALVIQRQPLITSNIYVPWLLWLGLMLGYGLASGQPLADDGVLPWSMGLIVFAAVMQFVRQPQQIRALLIVLLIGAMFFAARALWLIVATRNDPRAVVGVLRQQDLFAEVYLPGTVSGNVTGWLMAQGVAMSLGLLLCVSEVKLRWLSLLTLGLCLSVAALNSSRAGILASALAVVIIPWIAIATISRRSTRQRILSLLAGPVLLAAGWMLMVRSPTASYNLPRLKELFAGVENRIGVWQSDLRHFSASPLIGNGYAFSQAHSILLEIANVYGLAGLLLITTVFAIYFGTSLHLCRRSSSGWQQGLAVAGLGMLIVGTVQSFTDNTFNGGMPWAALFFIMRALEAKSLEIETRS